MEGKFFNIGTKGIIKIIPRIKTLNNPPPIENSLSSLYG